MREGKNWSTQWASFPAPLPHPSSPYTASSLRNKIQRAAWCSNNMTQLSVLILHYTSLLRNSERIFTLFLPHHFWPLRAVCFQIPRMMSGAAYDLSMWRRSLQSSVGYKGNSPERPSQHENNNKIVSRTPFSSIPHPIIILNHLWSANTE